MSELAGDTNVAVWKSDAMVKQWVAGLDARERKHADQLALMAQLLPFEVDDPFTLLDLGAGTGAAARAVMSMYPRARAILADFSPQMMGEGTRLLASFGDRYEYVEFDMLSPQWPAAIPAPLDAVVTSQCVHHLPDDRKRTLFAEIRERLAPGGWYVNYDPVKAPDPAVGSAWLRVNDKLDPEAKDAREHRTHEQQLRYENHVRYLTDLERQLDWLRAAGFAAVDVYWKQLDFVIFAGYRAR
jgi:SAM-dependent methyltransferase